MDRELDLESTISFLSAVKSCFTLTIVGKLDTIDKLRLQVFSLGVRLQHFFEVVALFLVIVEEARFCNFTNVWNPYKTVLLECQVWSFSLKTIPL